MHPEPSSEKEVHVAETNVQTACFAFRTRIQGNSSNHLHLYLNDCKSNGI